MTTILLDDNLTDKVLQIGNYKTAQEAVTAILCDYIESHKPKKTLFDKLRCDIDLMDDEIDSLFQRDKDTGRTIDL